MRTSRTACHRNHAFTLVEVLVSLFIIGVLISILLPAVQAVREAARRTTCINNARQVGIAVLNFESLHGRFPTNHTLVWTQQIVPQTEQHPSFAQPLSASSDHERERLLNHRPPLFTCPTARMDRVAGYPAAHLGINFEALGARIADITDGTSHTLLIGELQPFFSAPWVLGPTACEAYFGSDHGSGSHLVLADGSARYFATRSDTTVLNAMLTLAGGELMGLDGSGE